MNAIDGIEGKVRCNGSNLQNVDINSKFYYTLSREKDAGMLLHVKAQR